MGMVWSDTIINPYIFPAYFSPKLEPGTIFIAQLPEQISDKGQILWWIIICSSKQLGDSTLNFESLQCLTLSLPQATVSFSLHRQIQPQWWPRLCKMSIWTALNQLGRQFDSWTLKIQHLTHETTSPNTKKRLLTSDSSESSESSEHSWKS